MKSLYARLSLVFLCILLLLGAFSLWIAHHSAQIYFLEFTQRLNAPIAMYMAANGKWVKKGKLSGAALAELAEHVMMINPSVEVYLLNAEGRIVAQAADANTIAQRQVSLEPIHTFLQRENAAQTFPLLGDNPKNLEERRVFSAHPIEANNTTIGYIYVVLAGEQHRSLLSSIGSSYSVRTLVITLASVLLLALIGGLSVFFMLTYRLRLLTRRVYLWRDALPSLSPVDRLTSRQSDHQETTDSHSYRTLLSAPTTESNTNQQFTRLDEIDELAIAYDAMSERLLQQYHALEHKDQNRRELIANISHDLRTPLTTMQGYLETVLLKQHELTPDLQKKYLSIANKHGQRLRKLIAQLFELSKLSSGEMELQSEPFSLLEMAHDSIQDFAIRANESKISLLVIPDSVDDASLDVLADIALVHRVFENILDNALRFSSKQGYITISLERTRKQLVGVTVTDTGAGMSDADAKRIFEPRFSRHSENHQADHHAGLGLAIVHRILYLHSCDIKVRSKPGIGTSFTFSLPAATFSVPATVEKRTHATICCDSV